MAAVSAHPISKLILDSLLPDPPRGYTLDPNRLPLLTKMISDPSGGTAAVTALYRIVAKLSQTNAKPAATALLTLVMNAIDLSPKHRGSAGWGARR
jgi:hypothetical protein